MRRTVILLGLGLLFIFSCDNKEQEPEVSNVKFTPCKQSELRSSGEFLDKVDVEFTDKGVQITHSNFTVTCDFTTVNVTHTLINGVLNITQQGTPNEAKCICYTDVSYTIEGISQEEVNVIFINGVQVYCHNENNTLKGDWIWIKTYMAKVGMIDNEFKSILTIFSQYEDDFNYEVIVEDTLYYKGNFQLQYDKWNNGITNIELPYYNLGSNWLIVFMDIEGKPSKDTFYFFSGNPDDYMYYYQKIK